jgi:hypothetical protein
LSHLNHGAPRVASSHLTMLLCPRLTEAPPGYQRFETDEPGVLYGRLPMRDGVAINRVAQHVDESTNGGILRNETYVPVFLRGSDSVSSNLPCQTILPPRRLNTGAPSRLYVAYASAPVDSRPSG